MTIRELAIRLLENAKRRVESGWIQKQYARDVGGMPCRISDPNACQFCALGALWASESDLTRWELANYSEAWDARSLALASLDGPNGIGDLIDWNDADGRTQAEVAACFGNAIRTLKESAP